LDLPAFPTRRSSDLPERLDHFGSGPAFLDGQLDSDDHAYAVWRRRRDLGRAEARCGWRNAFHDRVPGRGSARRTGLCDETPGTHRAGRGRPGPRLYDSPPRFYLLDATGPGWHRVPAVAGRGNFWRERIRASTC